MRSGLKFALVLISVIIVMSILLFAGGAGAAMDTYSPRTYAAGDLILRADHIWIALWDPYVQDVGDAASNCAKNAISLKEGYSLAVDGVYQKIIPAPEGMGVGSVSIANFSLYRNGEIVKKASVTNGEYFYFNVTADGREYPVIEFMVHDIFSVDGTCSGRLIRLMPLSQYSEAETGGQEFHASPQEVPSEEWNSTFGRMNDDALMSVQQSADGGYLLARSFPSLWMRLSGTSIWLNKTDTDGNELWNKTIFEYGAEVYSVQRTADNGFVAAGEIIETGHFDRDAWLIKLDSNGSKQWSRTYGGEYDATASSVRQTGDGGYIIAGYTEEYGQGIWIIRTDPKGYEIWNRTLTAPIYSRVTALQWTDDNGCIIAGTIGTYFADFNDAILFKLDANGSEEWNRTFGGRYDDRFFSVMQTMDGGYLAAGMTELYGHDSWLVKTDANGSEEWNSILYDGGGSEVMDVLGTGNGYVLAGRKFTSEGSEVLLIKTDLYGNKQWSKTFGGERDDEALSVKQTKDGGYIIAGNTKSYGSGDNDAWLIKVSREPDGTDNAREESTNGTASSTRNLMEGKAETNKTSPDESMEGFEIVLAIMVLLVVYSTWCRKK